MTKTTQFQRQDIRLALDPGTDVLDCNGNEYLIVDLLDDIDSSVLETTTWKNKSWKLAAENAALRNLLRRAWCRLEECICHGDPGSKDYKEQQSMRLLTELTARLQQKSDAALQALVNSQSPTSTQSHQPIPGALIDWIVGLLADHELGRRRAADAQLQSELEALAHEFLRALHLAEPVKAAAQTSLVELLQAMHRKGMLTKQSETAVSANEENSQ